MDARRGSDAAAASARDGCAVKCREIFFGLWRLDPAFGFAVSIHLAWASHSRDGLCHSMARFLS